MRFVAAGLAFFCLLVTAFASAATARPAMTRTQADALARAVLLQASDLPGYNLLPATDNPTEDIWGNGRVAHCMGRRAFGRQLADVSSATFENPDSAYYESIGSEVEVMPSAAMVRKDLKQAGSSRGRRCLTKELHLGNLGRDAKVEKISIKPMSPRPAGGMGYQLKIVVKTRTRQVITLYSDVLAFGNGPIEAALFSITSSVAPDRPQLDQLFATLQQRVSDQLAASPTAP